MKNFVRNTTVKLIKLTSKNKVAFYILAAFLIPICAGIELCSNHLPELWSQIRENFSTLEDQRQEVLANPDRYN
jgi:hypothetical protein